MELVRSESLPAIQKDNSGSGSDLAQNVPNLTGSGSESTTLRSSVADPDPGSGAFLTPGSGIGFFWIPDLGSWIPNPYFWELSDNFLGKNFNNSLKIGLHVFLQHFKNKIRFNFVKFVATKKGMKTNFFHPSLLLLFLDPGSEIRIRDG